MKGESNKKWEFHGFASNPQKSYDAGRKGSRIAVEASLRSITPQPKNSQPKPENKQSTQNKSGQGWQNITSDESRKNKGSAEE